MKGSIIVNTYVTKKTELNQANRMAEEFVRLGVMADILPSSEYCVYVNEFDIKFKNEYDFCLFLDKDKHILTMLDKEKVRLFNSAKAIEICDDKLLTHIMLANSGVKMPKTIGGALCYYPQAAYSLNLLSKVERELGYPVIVKECYGSFGKNVYMANNRTELEQIAEQVKLKPHLFQQYIAASKGRDVRVIVIGGKAIGGMMRENANDFRSNVEIGGIGKQYTLTKQQIEVCEKVARTLDLDYCGIDLLLDEDETPIVCEVNSNAFFGTFESVTNINVAKIYAEHIVNSVK